MYNEEQKVKFITDTIDNISRRDLARSIFDAFEPYEKAWGADLCTQSSDTLMPALSELFGVRARGVTAWRPILHDYFRWCREHGISCAENNIIKIHDLEAGKLKKKMVTTPGSLQAYLNIICEPESDESAGNTVRAFLWLAYIGIRNPDDAIRVRNSDVDFKRFVVRLDGTDYRLYPEAIPAMRNCVKLRQFNYYHPNYIKPVPRDRVDVDYILRGIRAMPTAQTMKVEMSRRARRKIEEGATSKQLSYERTWLSGMFYRMWDREQSGMPVDFEEQARQDLRARSAEESHVAVKRVTDNYKADYERWKTMFV